MSLPWLTTAPFSRILSLYTFLNGLHNRKGTSMIHPILPAAALLAVIVSFIPASSSALSVTTVSQVTRPSSSTYGAEQISGITYAGGDLYYAVDDNDVKLYPLTLAISRSNGSLATSGITIGTGVTMASSHDMEGCAFDPCSGKVWISQETSALIREFDPATGELTRSAPVPAIQKQYAGNYSLEALTISGDGKTMWTANEEALKVDGELATNTVGSVVRLTRFLRPSVHDNWTPNGEWAYVTQPIGSIKDEHTRSGVSGLCALPDGTLLVLERRCYAGGLFPDFNIRLYQVNFAGATDVSSIASLKTATYTATTKTLLWQYTHGNDMPNYEGICLGPRLDDGSCVLVLISDGGSYAEEGVFTLKISGLNMRTLYVEGASDSEPAGGPYRYVDGTTVDVALPSAGSPYETITRVHAAWSAPANGASGEGSSASFAITADDIFTWSTVTNAALPLLATDSFERLPTNTEAPDLAGWSGDGYVAAATYAAPVPAGYPLTNETHTAVLFVDGDVERAYADIPGQGSMIDAMVRVTRESSDSPVADAEGQVALFFDTNGRATLQHRSADGTARLRTALSTQTFANGDWVRASFLLDYAPGEPTWCQIRLDGEPCVTAAGVRSPADPRSPGSWYRTLDATATKVSSLLLRGTGAVDDVAFYDAAGTLEFDVSATTNGVPYVWLTENGLPWDPALDADDDGFDARAEYAVGTAPLDEEDFFRIVGTGYDASGRFQVRFLGTASTSVFRVYASDDLSRPESEWTEATGTVARGTDGLNVWTETGNPGEARFFRIRVTLPEDAQ